MKIGRKSSLYSILTLVSLTWLASCSSPELEKCKFIEIEPGEFEVGLSDTDIEGWELEVLCDEQLWDVPWQQMKRNLGIDLKQYYDENPQQAQRLLQQLSQEISLYKKENKQENLLYGKIGNNSEVVKLQANKDD